MKSHISSILDDAERSGKLSLTDEQIAASLPGTSPEALRQALHRQQRRGRIVRLARGAGQWVIVTSEKTTGQGDYQGLPAQLHITYAQLTHTPGGWVISAWEPRT